MSVPVRSDARVNVRGFLSPSAHEGTQTRRDELVGTLSNQQIWGEQEPNVRLPSAKEEITENDINSPEWIRNTMDTLV